MTETICGAESLHAGSQVWCDMREGHAELTHFDSYAGVEWPK